MEDADDISSGLSSSSTLSSFAGLSSSAENEDQQGAVSSYQATAGQSSSSPQQQLSFLARHRRRRKIRAKLDEVARVVSQPRVDYDDALAFFSATSCAILTDSGEIIVTKSGSTRPFEAVGHKIRLLRTATNGLRQYLDEELEDGRNQNRTVIHLRGHEGIVIHAYVLGKHTLMAITEVHPGARNLDMVVERVDKCLGVPNSLEGKKKNTIIEQLHTMLLQF